MRRILLALVLFLMLGSAEAAARPGVRLGLTDDPDTLALGFFFEAPLGWAGSGFFAVEPGVDVGFGEDGDFFTLRGTLNGKYLLALSRGVFLYPILGISVFYINVEDCGGGDRCSETEAGGNLGAGFRWERVNFELTAGIADDEKIFPDVTLTIGFLF